MEQELFPETEYINQDILRSYWWWRRNFSHGTAIDFMCRVATHKNASEWKPVIKSQCEIIHDKNIKYKRVKK
jgi:hypothetical protein